VKGPDADVEGCQRRQVRGCGNLNRRTLPSMEVETNLVSSVGWNCTAVTQSACLQEVNTLRTA